MQQDDKNFIPLADRMRPDKLSEFFGQEELLAEKSYLVEAIKNDHVPSMILWGPPGSGKTTLAHIIAHSTHSEFLKLSAVASGKRDLFEIIEAAESNRGINKKTILFIDEIHRWNKSQQDALLPSVEKGVVTLIGATTENPSFEVNSALLSRARVFVLKKLEKEDLEKIIIRAAAKNYPKLKIDDAVLRLIAGLANGDARTALNTLEAAMSQGGKITTERIRQIFQKSCLFYDKTGEEHYNIISALHKSMRGGDADAAVYYLARMLEGGEDPLYIARRLVRFASEDVGLANNTALLVANAAFDACHKLGVPECNVHLAQCVIYLANSKKSIAAYEAYTRAKQDVEEYGNLPVPLHLRNLPTGQAGAPTKLMKDLGYSQGYKYTPKEDSLEQEYFPEEIRNHRYL
jgi:putative ATPase